MYSKINALNDELRMRSQEELTEIEAEILENPMIQKRKDRARKEAEKEQRKTEKALEKKQRAGGWHGRFNKKS